jgi:hypothetical protein
MEAYPADFNVDYANGDRNRLLGAAGIIPYVKQLLLLPHPIVVGILGFAAFFVIWIGYFIVLFTGKRLPDGMGTLISGIIGWSTRTYAWLFSLVDEYPPFELAPVGYAAEWTEQDTESERNRLLGLAGIFGIKFLLALPHFIVVGILGFAAFITAWVGFFIILFTGKLPEGIHTFIEGTLRWGARVYAWIAGLTDRYPPFSLDS